MHSTITNTAPQPSVPSMKPTRPRVLPKRNMLQEDCCNGVFNTHGRTYAAQLHEAVRLQVHVWPQFPASHLRQKRRRPDSVLQRGAYCTAGSGSSWHTLRIAHSAGLRNIFHQRHGLNDPFPIHKSATSSSQSKSGKLHDIVGPVYNPSKGHGV